MTTPIGLPLVPVAATVDVPRDINALANAVDGIRRIVAPPIGLANGVAGTSSSGSTEVRDAILGNYVFTALANRRYRAWWTGMMNAGTAGHRLGIRIRDGGSSTPTVGSPVIADSFGHFPVVGTPGRLTMVACALFAPTAGTHTLSAFSQDLDGGAATPIGTIWMYVEDCGAV